MESLLGMTTIIITRQVPAKPAKTMIAPSIKAAIDLPMRTKIDLAVTGAVSLIGEFMHIWHRLESTSAGFPHIWHGFVFVNLISPL